jgi:hypothetical protein
MAATSIAMGMIDNPPFRDMQCRPQRVLFRRDLIHVKAKQVEK